MHIDINQTNDKTFAKVVGRIGTAETPQFEEQVRPPDDGRESRYRDGLRRAELYQQLWIAHHLHASEKRERTQGLARAHQYAGLCAPRIQHDRFLQNS